MAHNLYLLLLGKMHGIVKNNASLTSLFLFASTICNYRIPFPLKAPPIVFKIQWQLTLREFSFWRLLSFDSLICLLSFAFTFIYTILKPTCHLLKYFTFPRPFICRRHSQRRPITQDCPLSNPDDQRHDQRDG